MISFLYISNVTLSFNKKMIVYHVYFFVNKWVIITLPVFVVIVGFFIIIIDITNLIYVFKRKIN